MPRRLSRLLLVPLLAISTFAQAQSPASGSIAWKHGPLVHLDSAGTHYNFQGLARSHPGGAVYYEGAHALPQGNSSEARFESLEYTPVPFVAATQPEWLEDQDEPTCQIAIAHGEPRLHVRIPAFRLHGGRIEMLTGYKVALHPTRQSTRLTRGRSFTGAPHSVLAGGTWRTIAVDQPGMYRITYDELTAQGFDQPSRVSLWGQNGEQLPYANADDDIDDLRQIPLHWVTKSGGEPASGDYALCYLPGPTWWKWDTLRRMFIYYRHEYDARSHFFITDSRPTAQVMQGQSSAAQHDLEQGWILTGLIGNQVNLAESGREYFGNTFRQSGELLLSAGLSGLVPGAPLRVFVRMAAASRRASHFDFYMGSALAHTLNVKAIPSGESDIRKAEVAEGVFDFVNPTSTAPDLRIVFSKPTPSSQAWLSRIMFNAVQQLRWDGHTLSFHTDSVGLPTERAAVRMDNLRSGVELWNVDDPFAPIRYADPNQATVPAAHRTHLVAFMPEDAASVSYLEPVANQDLHGMRVPDMLIVSHADFMAQAQRIAQIYRESPLTRMTVEVVDVEQVYREFSSGNRDVAAIRNLARTLYWRSRAGAGDFRYLLLMGKSLYTLKDSLGSVNYIPNYQSENSYNRAKSFGTDDFFGLLDEDEGDERGALDIGIGRYPVGDQLTADQIVNHEESYHNPANWGAWIGRALFLADDGDSNIFTRDAETLAHHVETNQPAMQVKRLYADAFARKDYWYKNEYPTLNAAINGQINRGAILFNYLGHASQSVLGHETFLEAEDVYAWRNLGRLPIFVAASCHLAQYDTPHNPTLGEKMLFARLGGAIAMISSSRIAYSSGNFDFNSHLIQELYPPLSGTPPRTLGDAYYRAKANSSGIENKRKFALLGNPALPLPDPRAEAKVVSLNGHALNGPTDTIRAGSLVQIDMELATRSGEPFEGEVYVTMQGPKRTITSRGNNTSDPITYSEHVGTAFRGKASVKNGKARTQWRIPVDMDCDYQPGHIVLLGISTSGICMGSYTQFTFGGLDKTRVDDTQGPEIALSLDDQAPRAEWVVGDSPLLVARLSDSSGINLSAHTAHAITAHLRGNGIDEKLTLNDYYTAQADTYQRGELRYRFHRLPAGDYRLELSAADTRNNTSTAEIAFRVVDPASPAISNLLNYPNPFTTTTSFYFDGTRPGQPTDVLIQIFTVDGQLVKTIRRFEASPSLRFGPYPWDGRDDWGRRLARGVYFYRVRLRHRPDHNASSGSAERFEKLLLL